MAVKILMEAMNLNTIVGSLPQPTGVDGEYPYLIDEYVSSHNSFFSIDIY